MSSNLCNFLDMPTFTEEEDHIFSRRLEEGFDITTDERYNLWLKTYHPSTLS